MARSPSRKKARPAPRKAAAPKRRPAAKTPVSRPKPAPPKPKAAPVVKKPKGSTPAPAGPPPEPSPLVPRTGDARRHLLSLSFLRDGDEFMARMESDSGQITELKNRSLDQLLSLVANELEDLLQ